MAQEVAGMLYTHASIAVVSTRGESGVICSERRMRMSWRYDLGRGKAKGKRPACFLGDETRTCKWNSRVPGKLFKAVKRVSRRLIDIAIHVATRPEANISPKMVTPPIAKSSSDLTLLHSPAKFSIRISWRISRCPTPRVIL